MPKYKPADVESTIELPWIYDGASVIVMKDGTRLNRWSDDDPSKPIPGYERRYQATQEWLDAHGRVEGHD